MASSHINPLGRRCGNLPSNAIPDSHDELWLLEHDPVFTQGQAGKAEHIINPQGINVIHTDRGGQVTYHGPGQLIAYPLINLEQQQLTIRSLVTTLEKCVIDVLASLAIHAESRCDAPGVYIDQSKICSIGLRVRRGCSYHGIALNVNMDLAPFSFIKPLRLPRINNDANKSLPTHHFYESNQ